MKRMPRPQRPDEASEDYQKYLDNLKRARDYAASHREVYRASAIANYQRAKANPEVWEKVRQAGVKRHQAIMANPITREAKRARGRIYRWLHREDILSKRRTPEVRAKLEKSVQARRSEVGEVLEAVRKRVLEENILKYGALTCVLCGTAVGEGIYNIEHLTPVCRGGNNEKENLGVAHARCNQHKGTMTFDEYQRYKASLKILVPV